MNFYSIVPHPVRAIRLNRRLRCVLAEGAIFALAGCAAAFPTSPGLPLDDGAAVKSAANGDLIYASAADGKSIYILSYPQGKLVRQFRPPAGTMSLQGLCSDTSGNVYVTALSKSSGTGIPEGHVYEYAHGGAKVLKTLNFSDSRPFGCAVDPSSGTLAVSAAGLSSRDGTLITFPASRSYGKTYYSYDIQSFYYCAYDAGGNLFVNGQGSGAQMYLDELQRGTTQLTPIALNTYVSLSGMGQLQWDGHHLTLEDLTADGIYQLQISGSKAKVLGKTRLYGWPGAGLSAIAGTNVIAPTGVSQMGISFWKYPAGGKALKTSSSPNAVFGLAISATSKR